MKFKGDIIITDPCYLKCNVKGIQTSTLYGDWSCTTFLDNGTVDEVMDKIWKEYIDVFNKYNSVSDKNEKTEIYNKWVEDRNKILNQYGVLGQFCADAGMVGVWLLEDVLKANPEFNYHIERPWTTTWIKGFEGDVEFKIDRESETVNVVGKGNINFITHQTGF